MTDYGVTPQGFNKKPLEAILKDIGDAQKNAFGAAFDTDDSTAQGQLNGTFSSALSEAWELLEVAFHGFDPAAAADYLLTVLASLTGTTRRAAKASTVTLTLNLNAGATVNAGALVSRAGRPDVVFETLATATNSGGAPADIAVAAQCTQTGPVAAPAGSLTVIVNSVSGWNTVTNAADAALGRNVDNDIILRQRREQQLALRGGSTVAAIKADLLDADSVPALSDMRAVTVLENTSDSVVAGMPPHSVEAIIDDGDTPTISNDVIAQVIWDSKPGGIATTGGASGTAVDANGDPQTVNFSRVTLMPVYVVLSLTKTSDYPVTGDTLVKEAIAAAGAQYDISDIVIALSLRASALAIETGGVTGVTDVPAFTLGFAPAPSGTSNLDPGLRGRATFSTTNITITP